MPMLQIAPESLALRPFVESLWYFQAELPHAHERILPTGAMQLLVNLHEDELRTYDAADPARVERLGGAALSGAYGRCFGIDTDEQRRIVGVAFKPGGAAAFFAEPARAFRDAHVPLDALWGRDGAVLRERLLEAPTPRAALRCVERVLLARAVRPLEVDALVDLAVGALDRGVPVRRLTESLGLSPNRFIRCFRDAVGLGPKRYARVRRFGRVLEAVELGRRVDWSAVAAACGYYDQAHLIHEFREFAGMSPTRYRPREEGARNHALVAG